MRKFGKKQSLSLCSEGSRVTMSVDWGSRAVLCHRGRAVRLTYDHKAEDHM